MVWTRGEEGQWTCKGQGMLKIEMPVRRKRGRPQRRFMDVVKDGMEIGWSERFFPVRAGVEKN